MRDFFIDYLIPIFAGMAIGDCIMQFTDSAIVVIAIAYPLCLLFGAFIYPSIAKYLRG